MTTYRVFNIRATHQYGFRSGEWAEVTGIEWQNNRPCFIVRFVDGVTDSWPVYDPSDPYEFRVAGLLALGRTGGMIHAELATEA